MTDKAEINRLKKNLKKTKNELKELTNELKNMNKKRRSDLARKRKQFSKKTPCVNVHAVSPFYSKKMCGNVNGYKANFYSYKCLCLHQSLRVFA